jgi:hypothetical protein
MSFLPSSVITGFCHNLNKLCAMLPKIPEQHGIITNKNDIEKLQKDLDTLGEWVVENGMKINPGKSKAIRFTRAWVKIHWVTPLVTKKFRKRAIVNTWK